MTGMMMTRYNEKRKGIIKEDKKRGSADGKK